MKNRVKLIKFGKIFCPIITVGAIAYNITATAQQAPGPQFAPNINLKIQRSSGNCPPTVGLWWFGLPYEGGAEHTVVANTTAFADKARLVVSTSKRFVEFVSPLRSNFASCVGKSSSPEYRYYNVEFKDRKVYFRVDLQNITAPTREITYKTVAASRPYVRWAIAD